MAECPHSRAHRDMPPPFRRAPLQCNARGVADGAVRQVGIGFESEQMIQQFNHDEFGFFKLRRYLPFRVAMVMRWHSSGDLYSVKPKSYAAAKRAAKDNEYSAVIPFLRNFTRYDLNHKRRTSGDYEVSRLDWPWYERLIGKYFPDGRMDW